MKLCVVGLGYIGLPTSVMFAKHGVDVLGVDKNQNVVDTLKNGKLHIEEPGLEELLKEDIRNGKIHFSVEPNEADAFIIAVPTPNNNDEYSSCDLTYVESAVRMIIPYIRQGNTIIIESTIAPRTTEDFVKPILEETGLTIGKDIYLAHCPERVLPGKILEELVYNNRIVGGVTEECTKKASEVYATFVKGEIIQTASKTAEMSKLMENTFRDVNIALANELTKICVDLDINVLDVIQMANKHPRVNIHSPGPGVGGHCLAVDPYFIYEKAPKLANIIKLARDTNNSMPTFVVKQVEKLLNYDKTKKIAALGVTYKGNVDDMRESPAVEIIEILKDKGYNVAIHDPHVNAEYMVDLDEAIENSNLILVLVEHDEFKILNEEKYREKLFNIMVFDTKKIIMNKNVINFGNISEYIKKSKII